MTIDKLQKVVSIMEKKGVGEEVEEKEVKEEDDKEKLVEEGGDKSEQ